MNSRIREIKHFTRYTGFLSQIKADGYADLLQGGKDRAEVSVPLYWAVTEFGKNSTLRLSDDA